MTSLRRTCQFSALIFIFNPELIARVDLQRQLSTLAEKTGPRAAEPVYDRWRLHIDGMDGSSNKVPKLRDGQPLTASITPVKTGGQPFPRAAGGFERVGEGDRGETWLEVRAVSRLFGMSRVHCRLTGFTAIDTR
jgi:hypothetical protein